MHLKQCHCSGAGRLGVVNLVELRQVMDAEMKGAKTHETASASKVLDLKDDQADHSGRFG